MPRCVSPDGCTSYCTGRCAGDEPVVAPRNIETIAATAVALVRARDEVARLRRERAACVCDFQGDGWREVPTPPKRTRRNPDNTDPCWKFIRGEYDDESGRKSPDSWVGDESEEGWCPSCELRRDLHAQYRAARRRVVSLTSGLLGATRAHMRREGLLPPLDPHRWDPKPPPDPVRPVLHPHPDDMEF